MKKLGIVDAPRAHVRTQPLSAAEEALLNQAEDLFVEFRLDTDMMRRRAKDCRAIFLLEDPYQDTFTSGDKTISMLERDEPPTIQLHTLQSTIINCIADQMDNLPDPVMYPETPELQTVAEDMTDVVRHVLDANEYPSLHRKRVEDRFVAGTAVTQIVWDENANGGRGDVAIFRYPIENIYWDASASDVQDCRAIFKTSHHPMGWYQMHYPDKAQYIGADHSDSDVPDAQKADELIPLLEYWYRKWDAKKKRHQVHVAYIAGGALLYMSEESKPDGLYAHGLYPFVFDVHTPIEGSPVGNSMVHEYAPMQRYINRYAKYIDANTRAAAHGKIIVDKGANIDSGELTNWQTQVVHADYLDGVRPFQPLALPATAYQMMAQLSSDMKMDSGQNQFNRGEGGHSVTAASAILALQEAGGKTARMHTAAMNSGFRRIVEQVMWLIHQFYTGERVLTITGRDDSVRSVHANRDRLFQGLPSPRYTIQVQIQRKNPMVVQATNEFIMSFANVCAQSGIQIPPDVLLDMLQIDGKDRFLPKLQAAMAQNAQIQQMSAALEQQQQQIAQYQAEMQGMQQMLTDQGRQLSGHMYPQESG